MFIRGFPIARKISLSKYFTCFLLNFELQNNLVLHDHSQGRKLRAKIFECEIFRAIGNPAYIYVS